MAKRPPKKPPQKPISIPSEKTLKDGEKSAKKAKAAGKYLPGGGYKKGGKVKCK